uniref:Uncharacterized protein n=1 Tax=Meloidogyne enterolobii TaxID=390850 RepID=A0A6V7VD42_MELEN|nr:unnamed protein product [Meloidogyne enterolobii]
MNESNIENQSNDLIKLQNHQKFFVEEKERNLNLENELKKIQKLNFDNEKEIEEMRQNFQKLQAEKDACLKQKDEKINSLEEEMKKVKIKIFFVEKFCFLNISL